jgi:DNA topoisomerase-1
MDLFRLPKELGNYMDETVEVNNGRFGPYVKYGKKFVSLPPGINPMSVELDEAIILIKEKEKADAPIYMYKDLPVVKGKGRFGPFIKWNNIFINVNRKYDWDNLSDSEIVELIEERIQKDIDKVVHHWEAEGIKVEKARWGTHQIIKGKTKIKLPKTVDASKLTLEKVITLLEKNSSKSKSTKRKTTTKKK